MRQAARVVAAMWGKGEEMVDKWGVVGQSGGPWGGAHGTGRDPVGDQNSGEDDSEWQPGMR